MERPYGFLSVALKAPGNFCQPVTNPSKIFQDQSL